ncbi:unnamed protein product [Owenia fusiformis]|uniref:Density-regulated protein n=1 Tax=Owenia fusiformis TaxID=6347 RepID=A0A8J1YAT0_OWEFU|nr:unnamed protein product [Owenia fusiformis]
MADNAEAGDGEEQSKYIINTGPRPDITYPIEMIYCGECSMPVEYCEYHPNYEKCKEWMAKNLPDELQDLLLSSKDDGADGDEKKKRQTRGGRGVIKAKKKAAGPQKVCLARQCRQKRKYSTIITGLATYDIDLKVACKALGQKFACGASISGPDDITVQGDIKDELWDFIEEKWPQIDEDNIEDLGDLKKGKT